MKKIYLKRIELSNWKGQNRSVDFLGSRTTISGRNGSGKTSIYKAFCWLLTAYTDAVNVKNHELYDNTKELTQDTPEAKVRAVLDIDGKETILERSAKSTFIRKRGSEEYVKSPSDTYKLRIDDIETSAFDFNMFVESTFGSADNLPYMLMGEKFANLSVDDKNKARKVLESIVGTIDEKDMSGDYSLIHDDMVRYGIDALRDRYKNELKPLKQRAIEIDAIIKNQLDNKSRIEETDFNAISAEINALSEEIADIDNKILLESKSYEVMAEKQKAMLKKSCELASELNERRRKYNERCVEELSELSASIKNIDVENAILEKQNKSAIFMYSENNARIEECTKNIEILTKRREELVSKRNEVKASVFSDTVCVYCGQELPADRIESHRKKFNDEKNRNLELIIEEGKHVSARIAELKKTVEGLEEVKNAGCKILPLKDKSALVLEYNNKKNAQPKFEDTDEYKNLSESIDKINEEAKKLVVPSSSELSQKKRELMIKFEAKSKEYGRKAVAEEIGTGIENMKKEKSAIGVEIAKIENMIDKVKEYIEERADIISTRINTKLQDCKIVMYSKQKDGEIKPDCVVVSNDGVKYSTINNSSRIKMCLSLQRMFCEHYGIDMPMFVDESSIFDSKSLPIFDTQMVYLFASDNSLMVTMDY